MNTEQNPLVALANHLKEKGDLDHTTQELLESLSNHLVEFGEHPRSVKDVHAARGVLRNVVNKLKSGHYSIEEMIEWLEELANGAEWHDGDLDIEDDLGNPQQKMHINAKFLKSLMHNLGEGTTKSQDVEEAFVNAMRVRDAIVARRALGEDPGNDLITAYDNALWRMKNAIEEQNTPKE